MHLPSTTETHRVRKAVFQGLLPVVIHVDPTELEDYRESSPSSSSPEPSSGASPSSQSSRDSSSSLYVMAPRCGYLLWISEQLLDNLRNLPLPEIEYPSSLWYSRHGEPLPWHLPLGLLYDLDRSAHPSDPPLPWTIQVHTRGYPIDRLLPPPCDDLLYAHHMSMMKESDVLRHGSANKVMRLSKEDQTSLFNSLRQGDMEGFWRVNGQLVGLGDPRNIPVRIYLPHQASPYQCLIPAVSKEGETTCLSHLLQELPSQWVSREEDGSISPTVQVLLHGVPLPRDIPLTWASEALAYADNFLYLILSSSS